MRGPEGASVQQCTGATRQAAARSPRSIRRLRACWAVHGPVRVRGDAEDVHVPGLDLHHEQAHTSAAGHRTVPRGRSQQARIAGCLGVQELPPRRRRPPRRGTEPGGGQDPADRPLPYPVPQAEQLTLDPPVAPARVLPRQLLHQRADLGRDRRPSRRVRIGPLPADQAPVPGQQRARGHDPVQPQPPGQQPGQGGEHGTVSPVRPRAARPAGAAPRPRAAAPRSPRPWRRHCAPAAPASRTPGP